MANNDLHAHLGSYSVSKYWYSGLPFYGRCKFTMTTCSVIFLMLTTMPFIITRTFTETSEVFHTFPTERPRICPRVITPGTIRLDLEVHELLQYLLIVMFKEIIATACQC